MSTIARTELSLASGTWVQVYRREMSENHLWAPDACTLPTAEHPVRQGEWVDLFATNLQAQSRVSSTRLHWWLDPRSEAVARDLARRETACCSFFTFDFVPRAEGLQVEVEVPPAYERVLDGLAELAEARAATP